MLVRHPRYHVLTLRWVVGEKKPWDLTFWGCTLRSPILPSKLYLSTPAVPEALFPRASAMHRNPPTTSPWKSSPRRSPRRCTRTGFPRSWSGAWRPFTASSPTRRYPNWLLSLLPRPPTPPPRPCPPPHMKLHPGVGAPAGERKTPTRVSLRARMCFLGRHVIRSRSCEEMVSFQGLTLPWWKFRGFAWTKTASLTPHVLFATSGK